MVIDNVLVSPDFTTELNFSLEQTVAATLEAVKVEAERPSDPAGRHVHGADPGQRAIREAARPAGIRTQPRSRPASSAARVILGRPRHPGGTRPPTTRSCSSAAAGANEVAYFVDGFSQQDPLTGYSTTSINTNAVEQVVVMTGGFDAEYGRIMSGAVNVVTKEGRPQVLRYRRGGHRQPGRRLGRGQEVRLQHLRRVARRAAPAGTRPGHLLRLRRAPVGEGSLAPLPGRTGRFPSMSFSPAGPGRAKVAWKLDRRG